MNHVTSFRILNGGTCIFINCLIWRLLEFITENPLQCSESLASSGPSDDSQTDSQPVSTHGKILVQGPVKEGTGVCMFEFVLLHARN